jgi:hypothetical protein
MPQMDLDYDDICNRLMDAAALMIDNGIGYAQQGVVLAHVLESIPEKKRHEIQQFVLTCWHDLFVQGKLSWGYNLDNPGPPFFHIPASVPERAKAMNF